MLQRLQHLRLLFEALMLAFLPRPVLQPNPTTLRSAYIQRIMNMYEYVY